MVLADGSSLDEDAIKSYVAEEVATYKRLGHVKLVDSIPKSNTGKILRRELRDQVSA